MKDETTKDDKSIGNPDPKNDVVDGYDPKDDESPKYDPFKKKKSVLRKEIESALSSAKIESFQGVILIDLDSNEQHHFDSYPQAIEFMQRAKGRWYLQAWSGKKA